MAEKQRIKVPADNYGRVYIGMLESPLSAHAKLCYGVMWSFGQESWASLEAIGRRMAVSKPTVIKAQAELAAAGWITLLEDSKGRLTKSWLLNTPTVNELYPNGKGDLPLTVNAVDTKKEGNQEPKKEKPAADAASASKLIAIFCEEHGSLRGSPYKPSGKDVGQAKIAAKLNPDFEAWFRPAARSYLVTQEAWVAQAGFTLSAMLGQLNKWAGMSSNRQKRPCQHTETTITETRGTSAAHKCNACGVVTWR